MKNTYFTWINNIFGVFVGYIATVLFFKILGFPLIVLILLIGAITFTFYFRFINIRGFIHSINITRGKYDNPEGEKSGPALGLLVIL